VRQALRPDAAAIVAALKRRGLAVRILSGDRPAAVASVATQLDITDWSGGMKPAEKIAAIEAMKAAGHRVLMVGDGLNDAPSLAGATASIAPLQGADLAQAQADAVFLGERLHPVLDAVEIAARSRRLMLENLVLAVVYNALAIPLAAAGFVTPLIAAAAMSGSSMLVTLNALRVRLPGRAQKADTVAVAASDAPPLHMVEQVP
jgi:Cu2+-exporting ATPase